MKEFDEHDDLPCSNCGRPSDPDWFDEEFERDYCEECGREAGIISQYEEDRRENPQYIPSAWRKGKIYYGY